VKRPNLALAERHETNPGELQALEQGGDILLIAGKPVERFRDNNVEGRLADAREHRLISGSERRRAAHRRVPVDLDEPPVFAGDPLLAEADLIID